MHDPDDDDYGRCRRCSKILAHVEDGYCSDACERADRPAPRINLGIVRGLPAAAYHADPGVNSTTLRAFARSAAHARHELLHPSGPTEAMELGTAVHAAVLEPELWRDAYVCGPAERRTKASKDAWELLARSHPNATILLAEAYRSVEAVCKAVHEHPTVGPLLREACHERELSVFWERQGRRCKARLDAVSSLAGWTWIVDVKTTRDASPHAFAGAVARYGYHVQAAWYLAALDSVATHPRRFAWIAIEPTPPWAVACYEATPALLDQGDREAREYFGRLLAAERSGIWPSYTTGIEPLELPRWAYRPVGDEVGDGQ